MNALKPVRSALLLPDVIEKSPELPASRSALMAFVADAESRGSLENCLSDLSFSNARVLSGGILRAIRHFGSERSPNILIVDVSDVDMPSSRVHELANVCEPAVTVIAIGDRNDVGLYRDLMQAGVNEYIVKPVTSELLAHALFSGSTTSAVTPINQKRGKMVGVIGARGGVGATTLAVNLAWYLAARQSRRVALVDLDLQNGGCALSLNVRPTGGLREALTNPDRIDNLFLERAMTKHSDCLFVLCSEEPLRDEIAFTADAVSTLINALRAQFHYVIIDVPRFTAAPYRLALDAADRRIIVVDRTLLSVRDTARLQAVLGGSDAARRNLFVVNRSGEGGRKELTLEEIFTICSVSPKLVIPFLPEPFAAAAFRARVVASRPGKFAEAVALLAGELSGRMPERRTWWRRLT